MLTTKRRVALAAATVAAIIIAAMGAVTGVASAAVACRVDYAVSAQWPGGFTANVTIDNLGDPVNGWRLTWSFSAGQRVTEGWNASFSQSGSQVTATNASWNAALGTGATASMGFNGSWSGSNPAPAGFALNGTTCSGGGGTPTTTTPGQTTTTTSLPTSTTNPPPSSGGPVGWAATNGGTTGGAGGSTVTVTNASALDSALQSSSRLIIRVSGMISLTGMHKVASNKSVLGVGSNSGITGGGLNLSGVRNVIVRNLVFRNADDDSINLQNGTHNIWIDHNDLASGHDGLTDIKRGSDFVTVSWNHYHDHDKTALLGHDDGNAAQDRGHLRVTYHHNWFDATTQRHPRVRFGNPAHVYNNDYLSNSGYGVASTIEGGVLVEGNYFDNVEDPDHLGEGSSPPGSLVARNNVLVNSGSGQTGGSVAAIPYGYTLDTPSNVKSIVTDGAGTGKNGL